MPLLGTHRPRHRRHLGYRLPHGNRDRAVRGNSLCHGPQRRGWCVGRGQNPGAIRAAVPAHVEYWRTRNLPEYIGGPFVDRTGSLITFAASNLDAARDTVQHDPFVEGNLVEDSWVKEWRVE